MKVRKTHARQARWDFEKIPGWTYVLAILALLATITLNYVHLGRSEPFFAEFFILPVLIAAFRYKVVGGLACGLICALLAGPIAFEASLPHVIAPDAAQYLDWLMLLVYSSILGIAAGTAFMLLYRSKAEALRIQNHDKVTGLPNLEGLRWLMAKRFADAKAPVASFSKYAIRINNYQSLINAFGYPFADEFIRKLSVNLRELFSSKDLIARVSPSTLAVVIEGTPESHLPTCRKLLSLQQTHPVTVDEIPVYPEISIGAAWNELNQLEIDHLFSNAELAATEARYDPERIILYSPATRTGQRDRIRLLGSFSQAMKDGHIQLEYQPKLDLANQRIVSVEALARWNDPKQGPIPPSRFIPLLEETRIINTLSTWIMREAILQIRAWRDKGLDIGISINVSARNFDVAETFDGLDHMLREHGVEGSSLEMEITETSFIHLTERMLQTIASIRGLGVRIAIDDFGTGYASLSYLRQLPIDVLKLDQSFVNEGLEHPHNLLMVKRMVQIAKDRNLLVVAEGVERESALRAVRKIGVDQVQGHYISKSLPPDELEAMVRQWNASREDETGPDAII